jgi:4a-hydroxytetrahydrobiopterin dehydratase
MTPVNDADKSGPATTVRKPPLNWRFEFSSYGEMRRFLDQLAEMSKRDSYYPNINFGKTYVNVSIDAEGQEELGARAVAFIQEMTEYAAQNPA